MAGFINTYDLQYFSRRTTARIVKPTFDEVLALLRAHNKLPPIAGGSPDTFGVTAIGGTEYSPATDNKVASIATAPEAGTATAMYVYARGNPDGNGRMAMYSSVSGAPSALLASSNPISLVYTAGWLSASISYSFNAGDYWLAVHAAVYLSVYYGADTGSNTMADLLADAYSDGFADPYGTPPGYLWRKHSEYVEYTPAGAGTPAGTLMMMGVGV